MLLLLTLFFGGVILIDNARENSTRTKMERKNAHLLSIKKLEQYKSDRKDYVKKQLALWQSTGLPPNKWK